MARGAWGAAVGLGLAIWILGADFLSGDQAIVRQVAGDNAAGLAAFRVYIADGWHWPLLDAPGFGSAGVNVAFSDSIPVLAIMAKSAAPLGIAAETWWSGWFGLVYGLQGVAAVYAVRAWGGRTTLVWSAAPFLAVLMPVLLVQTVHPSLSAQFVVLLAIGLAGRSRIELCPQRRSAWVGLTLLSLAIHPYLAAMVLVVLAGAVADGLIGRRIDGRSAARWLAATALALSLWLVAGGYISSTGSSEGGYGLYATAVAGPVVPTLSGLLGPEPDGFEVAPSHAGYAYLGVGTIVLVAAAGVASRRRVVRAAVANQGLALALVVLGVWAVSPFVRLGVEAPLDLPAIAAGRLGSFRRAGIAASALGAALGGAGLLVAVRLGWHRHHRLPIAAVAAALVAAVGAVGLLAPDVVSAATIQFRASGRFAWPILYAAPVFALAALGRPTAITATMPSLAAARPRAPGERRTTGLRQWRAVAVATVVVASLALQVADTATLRSFSRELLVPGGEGRQAYLGHLVEVVAAHDRVVLGPDFRCTYYPDGVGTFIDVTSAASAAEVEIDRIYSARAAGGADAETCTVPQDVDLSDPDAVVVLIEPVSLLHDANAAQQIAERCRKWGTVNVCSDRWADVPPATLAFFGPLDD